MERQNERQNKNASSLIAKQSEVQEWMEDVLKEKFESNDFAESLSNGVLLCKLANAISPGSITKINVGGNLRFKFIENIQKFCDFCKKYGINENMVFRPGDLIDQQNLMKVVNTIQTLSNLAIKNTQIPQMKRIPSQTITRSPSIEKNKSVIVEEKEVVKKKKIKLSKNQKRKKKL